MKALLICPSIRPAVPHLAETGPLVTAQVLGDSIVCHWIEHLAALGARRVRILASDRADKVRADVGDGARWGVRVEVISTTVELSETEAAERFRPEGETDWLPGPHAILRMSHLPGCPNLPLFESYAGWFEAVLGWLPHALTPSRVRVSEIAPGIWVGRRARVSPQAKLIGPCWIGDQVYVEPGAVVGPSAIIEDRAVVEGDSLVTQSWVAPDTFIGPMTSVAASLASGSTLVNWRTDSSLHVPDPFLMCSLARPQSAALIDRFGRSLAKPGHDPRSNPNWIDAWRARSNHNGDFKGLGRVVPR